MWAQADLTLFSDPPQNAPDGGSFKATKTQVLRFFLGVECRFVHNEKLARHEFHVLIRQTKIARAVHEGAHQC